MKTVVERSNAAYKESAGRLNTATLDRAGNAVTYRIYGCEKQRSGMYEKQLDDYEKTAVRAGMQVVAMPPLYQVISMGSERQRRHASCGCAWRARSGSVRVHRSCGDLAGFHKLEDRIPQNRVLAML